MAASSSTSTSACAWASTFPIPSIHSDFPPNHENARLQYLSERDNLLPTKTILAAYDACAKDTWKRIRHPGGNGFHVHGYGPPPGFATDASPPAWVVAHEQKGKDVLQHNLLDEIDEHASEAAVYVVFVAVPGNVLVPSYEWTGKDVLPHNAPCADRTPSSPSTSKSRQTNWGVHHIAAEETLRICMAAFATTCRTDTLLFPCTIRSSTYVGPLHEWLWETASTACVPPPTKVVPTPSMFVHHMLTCPGLHPTHSQKTRAVGYVHAYEGHEHIATSDPASLAATALSMFLGPQQQELLLCSCSANPRLQAAVANGFARAWSMI
jgi:hypothetical protein